ncbi:Calx-beta domain-containing protein [Dokdonella sp.]|uniref:Calx-beta domain-containing protein n=1 Tax=Dokdonella sp. TaxID=2291710 RepID=UPI003C4E74C1
MKVTSLVVFVGLCLAFGPDLGLAQDPVPIDTLPLTPATVFHGESPSLLEISRNPVEVLPGNGQLFEFELDEILLAPELAAPSSPGASSVLQQFAPKPLAAVAGVSFEGPGLGLPGFTLTGAPPDMTLAVGPNHIVAWVNSQFAVYNKSGTVLVGPLNGNSLFVGVGGVCETTNRGDPILQYDRLADRWILSQFAFSVSGSNAAAPYFQCFAVSTTGDPTGSYVRYTVQFSSTSPGGLNDYGKLGVWPDGYYTAYNMFGGSPAGSFTGVALCASDRTKMLVGDPTATTLCAPIASHANLGSFLPADLDGTTLPSDLTQGGIFMSVTAAGSSLRYLKLKPNFVAGTISLGNGVGGASGSYISIPIGATTYACNGGGGACISQPGTTNRLDTLGTRLMYRLAYRNRDGIESMMVTHSVDPDGSGSRGAALRWYEIRNPLGNPSDPVVANRPVLFQNGTYDPGATGDRWMGSIAMDRWGNMLMGYTIANAGAGVFPSMAVAGREVGDAPGTLQAEVTAVAGGGSQTGNLTRWGDYSTIQVDPVDDRTFWYIGQYLSADGSFNWRSRVVSYTMPVPPASLGIDDASVGENAGVAQFTITRSHTEQDVDVRVDTSNGTATAGTDYLGISNLVVQFSAGGSATATVNVTILDDSELEAGETFNVNLSNAVNATIADGTGLGTILNDDSASIAINDVTQAEGNAGTTNFVFTVSLSGAVQGGFSVPFSTASGTATQPGDYASNSGTLSFTGSPGETRTITVAVVGDTVLEPNETFVVNLGAPSNAGVTVSDDTGQGTINNDDAASVAVNNVSQVEGDSGTSNFVFTVSLSGSVQGGFSVPFSTANGTATQPGDYASNIGTLNFTGTTSETRSITVAVVGDLVPEIDETFFVNLGAASAGVTVGQAQGAGLVLNDDLFADVSVSNSDGVNWVAPLDTTTYTIVVTNNSTIMDVPGVAIVQTLPALLSNVSWTCAGTGGATCATTGTGAISQTRAMPKSSSLTYLVTASVAAPAGTPPSSINTSVTATVQPPVSDTIPGNNTASDNNTLITDIIFRDGFQ